MPLDAEAAMSPLRATCRAMALVVVLAASGDCAAARPPLPAGTVAFPSDALTVADARQATGRRVALALPDCALRPSDCDELRLINELDGFDVDPRIAVRLDAPPADLDALGALLTEEALWVEPVGEGEGGAAGAAGGRGSEPRQRMALNRFVYDPATTTLYGHPTRQLREATRYRVVYAGGGQASESIFTTTSASAGLVAMRRQLDDGSAYEAAGIGEHERGIALEHAGRRSVFTAHSVVRIARYNETASGGPLTVEPVPNTGVARAGLYGFGSFKAPSWLDATRTIAQAPTASTGPGVTGFEQVGVALILPAGEPPAGGWPTAIFGPGISRSKYDVFLAGNFNAARGIATIALDPAGHGYGPRSEVGVTLITSPREVRLPAFGRGRDLDGDGAIGNQEGISAPAYPHPKAAVALRDGLRQTAADVMTLVRAIARGVDVDGDGRADLRREGVALYAQSLGGIYGTMVMGVDPLLQVGVLNVPGGPVTDIGRLAPGFRPQLRDALRDRIPGLLNGGRSQFTESLPLYLEPPVTDPAAGSLPIQEALARIDWIDRAGSPETFAPRLRAEPLPGVPAKKVLYQFAFGDQTVPNPTSATIARAGGLSDVSAFYRNDLTVTRNVNPHGFLLDPRVQGYAQAQAQTVEFLASGGAVVIDPDGPAPTWEVPIADPTALERLNFDPALYG
ncbi:MAG: hypothetical protein M3N52_11735, partial [Actinomycetota bacterium]|nr:hypothetical protein [Actinomycetota bacterium]